MDSYAAETKVLRYISSLMYLFGLCQRRDCRRARDCHGDPRDCLTRYAPLVPEAAREGVKTMLDGQHDGLAFDDVREGAEDEIDALMASRATVAELLLPSPSPRSRGEGWGEGA